MVHTRLLRTLFPLCAALVLGSAACGTGAERTPVVPAAGPWETIDSLDTRAFREAWSRPATLDHERTIRVEELDASDEVLAFREITVRFLAADSVTIAVRADSSGAFGFGMFDGLARGRSGTPDPPDPSPYVMPEDASFMSARNREKYAIRIGSDSTASDGADRHIEVEALSGPGDGEIVRRVRYATRGADDLLLSVDLEREDAALLFTDRSRASASTRWDGSGGLLPMRSVYETWIIPRFGRDRRFRITTTWTYPSR